MLRSMKDLEDYAIRATDGIIGHVKDYYFDDEARAIRYMVVDTSNWWLGHKVLIAPQWIKDVSWPDATVSVDLTRQAVQDGPPYVPTAQLDRRQETGIYQHYGRSGYWAAEVKRKAEISHH
jgi:hypothetical protein